MCKDKFSRRNHRQKKKKILKIQKYAIQYYQEQTIILMLLAYKSSEFAAQKQ